MMILTIDDRGPGAAGLSAGPCAQGRVLIKRWLVNCESLK
jgi:hypothetical protein